MESMRWNVGLKGLGVALAVGLMLLLLGCGGDAKAQPDTPDEVFLDRWEGPLRALFDDSIHPAAVGLSLEGRPPQEDPMLRSRVVTAEVVARMRVSTVTVDSVGAKVTYYLTLQVGHPTLLPPKLEDRNLEITVRKTSPAYGIVSNLDASLRGRTFIGFVKRFTGPQGPEIHWHLTADTPEVAAVVSETSVLDEVAEE